MIDLTNIENKEEFKQGITGYGNVIHTKDDVILEHIVLTNGMCEEKEEYIVKVNSGDWYALKCVEVPQKIARKHFAKGTNRHFELTDLESFLTEEAYKIYIKYDTSKHSYFETYLRRCLGKKVSSFFRDSKVDKLTDLETSIMSKNEGESEGNIQIFDEPVDIWAELHGQLEVEYILSQLEPEEQFIAKRLLDGRNSSEIAVELNTYRLKVRRALQKIIEKAKLEKPKTYKGKRNLHVKSTSNPNTIASARAYKKYREKLDLNNKILFLTAKVWGMESIIDNKVLALDGLEGEELFKKEAEVNTLKEVLDLNIKELEKLEETLKKI